jgi:two-component system response regulator FlrC
MPNVDGLSMLKMLKIAGIFTPVTFITAYGTIDNAVEALKLGAFDYILKPFSAEAIEELIKRALSICCDKIRS